ncbi:MAG: response regulator [Chloroflexi bacterium OHK40]
MSSPPPELERFIHALLSPLTALHGAVGLLQRRLQGHPDPHLPALIAALERSSERLRVACDLILRGATLRQDRITIELALSDLAANDAPAGQPDAPMGLGSVLRYTEAGPHDGDRRGGGLTLVIAGAGSPAEAIGETLLARGHHVVRARSSAEGLDRARELQPALVLIDLATDAQSDSALHILAEDPDTKGILRAILGVAGDPGSSTGRVLTIDPRAPATEAAMMIEQALAPGAAGSGKRPHILIVDDEHDIASLLALQFLSEGYQTSTVYSGSEALRIVREHPFDLILLDVLLPDIDGFAVLGGLRAQREAQLTPIILVSAIDSAAEKVRGLQLGADDYITKPFSAAELSASVLAAMRRSEREGGANPSTRLPGNNAIERAISQRITRGEPFAVCYADIDNFKAYNDSYGFLKGDAVIQRTAQILLDSVRIHGNADDFVGHIGGDDFVVITTPDRVAPICEAATARFDATAPLFYGAEARAQGFISAEDRQGRPAIFPLVSISISVVSSAHRTFQHPGEVAQRAAEAKKRAKLIAGSTYLVEGGP